MARSTTKNPVTLTWLAAMMIGVTGCTTLMDDPPTASRKNPPSQEASQAGNAEYLSKATTQKASAPGGETAVEKALEWADKYSQATARNNQLQRENRDLLEKSLTFQNQVASLQAELARAQQELKEANTMLLQIRQELEKWKGNVLGFRQEMRSAQQLELEQLMRILKVLGAETQPASQPARAAPAEAGKEAEGDAGPK